MDPSDPVVALLAQIKILIAQRNWMHASEYCDRATALSPDDPRVLILKSQIALEQNHLQAALAHAQVATSLAPEWPPALYSLACVHLATEQWIELETIANQIVELAPNWSAGHYLLGKKYLHNDVYIDAIRHFREALRLHPDDTVLLTELCQCLLDGCGPQEAFDHLEALARSNPDNSHVLTLLGWQSIAMDRPAQAVDTFRAALALDPYSSDALLGLYDALLRQTSCGRFAITTLRAARRIFDGDRGAFIGDFTSAFGRLLTVHVNLVMLIELAWIGAAVQTLASPARPPSPRPIWLSIGFPILGVTLGIIAILQVTQHHATHPFGLVLMILAVLWTIMPARRLQAEMVRRPLVLLPFLVLPLQFWVGATALSFSTTGFFWVVGIATLIMTQRCLLWITQKMARFQYTIRTDTSLPDIGPFS